MVRIFRRKKKYESTYGNETKYIIFFSKNNKYQLSNRLQVFKSQQNLSLQQKNTPQPSFLNDEKMLILIFLDYQKRHQSLWHVVASMVLHIFVVPVSIVDSESVFQCMKYIGLQVIADGRNYLRNLKLLFLIYFFSLFFQILFKFLSHDFMWLSILSSLYFS